MYQEEIRELEGLKRALNQQMNEMAESVANENKGLSNEKLNKEITEAIQNFVGMRKDVGRQIRRLRARERKPYFARQREGF